MSVQVENFVFGSDFLEKSEAEFKAHMKRTHGVGARKAKELYKGLHGKSISVPEESTEGSE